MEALRLPPLPGQGIVRPRPEATWIYKVRESQGAHTQQVAHPYSFSSKCELGECQREREIWVSLYGRDTIWTWVRWRRLDTACCDCERLLTFWTGGMYGKPDSDSELQKECPEKLFKRGAEVCWAGTWHTAALPAKGRDWGHGMLPLSAAGRLIRKVQRKGISEHQSIEAGRVEAVQSGECRPLSAVRAVNWKLEAWELCTWDYLKAERASFPGSNWASGKRRSHPAPTCCRLQFCKGKTARGMPRGTTLNFFQGDKIHLFLGPYFTKASKAGRSENGIARGNQDPVWPCSHTELLSTPRRRELNLLHRLSPTLR